MKHEVISEKNRRLNNLFYYATVVLLVTGVFFFIGIKNYRNSLETLEADCFNAVATPEKLLNVQKKFTSVSDSYSTGNATFVVNSTARLLEKAEKDYRETLSELTQRVNGNYALKLIQDDGKIIALSNIAFPEFSENQLALLAAGKSITENDFFYVGCRGVDFLLILRCPLNVNKDVVYERLLSLTSSDLFVFDYDTGDIIVSNTDLVRNNISELDFLKNEKIGESRYRKGVLRRADDSFFNPGGKYRFYECNLQDGNVICSLYHSIRILKDLMQSVVIPFVVSMIFALVTLRRCIRLSEDWRKNNIRGLEYKLFGIVRVDGTLSGRVASMIGVCGIIALIFSAFFTTLPSLSNMVVQSHSALNLVDNVVSFGNMRSEQIREKYEEEMMSNLSFFEFLLEHNNGEIDPSLVRNFADNLNAEAVTFFDSDGTIEFDTSRQVVGYKLSSNPDSKEYGLWDLLNGEPGEKVVYCDDEMNKVFFAFSRPDKVGMVRVTVSNGAIAECIKMLSQQEVVKYIEYPANTILLFGKTDNPEKLECYYAGTDQIVDYNNGFPERTFVNEYSGTATIKDKKYHISTKISGDNLYICADGNYNSVLRRCINTAGVMLALYIAVGLVIFKASGVEISKENTCYPETHSEASSSVLMYLDNTITLVFRLCVVAILALILLEFILLKDYAVDFFTLVTENKKGFSLATIGFSFFVFMLANAASMAIAKISQAFNHCIPGKKVTICQLFTSLLKFFIYAYALIVCLKQFNITTAQFMAFLGISGLAFGLGAKDLINDFIAGACIIMDRHINVGDYIEVNGFHGKVSEITIRTTKIKRLNKTLCVNNSEMRNVINNSTGEYGIFVSVIISYENNVDDFIRLIEKNVDAYRKADTLHYLHKDPVCLGIDSFENTGIKVLILSYTDYTNREYGEYLVRNVTKKIMEENNIAVPVISVELPGEK